MRWLVVAGLAYVIYKLVPRLLLPRPQARSAPGSGGRRPTPGGQNKRSAYQVLGVSSSASLAEIRHAYQEKVRKYHPDRVAGAARELQDLAELRCKELNAAYDELRSGTQG